MAIATINPATGQGERVFEPLSDKEIDACLAAAAAAFAEYRTSTFDQRANWLRTAADLLDQRTPQLAELMTTEMGKPIAQARAEVGKCAKACRFYAEHAPSFLADERLDDADAVGASAAYTHWQPLGPVLAVMPWNFPLWQVIRFAAPALMAGNVALLKHASNVPQTALALADLLAEAGFPPGVFQTLLIGSAEVERILRDDRVVAATLTGSEPAGRAVAAVAGDAIKKTVLELGGSDPFIVMPSADVERAAEVAVTARVQNNGQSCIAAKRFTVHAEIAERFTEAFVRRMSELVVGDPLDERTDVGPLATDAGRKDVEELVADAVAQGATVRCGGTRPDGPGWFYAPTVLTDVTPAMRAYHEEVFGPVAVLHTVPDLESAIVLANDTGFGLGANAWTEDAAERVRFVDELEAGAVFVNGMVTSFPELPFGGVKRSGYGRELAALGIREFCNAKTIWVGK